MSEQVESGLKLMRGGSESVFLANLHHYCAQTDGTYAFPNSMEGDLLKTAKREIEELRNVIAGMAPQVEPWRPACEGNPPQEAAR